MARVAARKCAREDTLPEVAVVIGISRRDALNLPHGEKLNAVESSSSLAEAVIDPTLNESNALRLKETEFPVLVNQIRF